MPVKPWKVLNGVIGNWEPGTGIETLVCLLSLILAVGVAVNPSSRHCLPEGVDELGYILKNEAIAAFDARREGSIDTLA